MSVSAHSLCALAECSAAVNRTASGRTGAEDSAANSPKIVTELGSPPNDAILRCNSMRNTMRQWDDMCGTAARRQSAGGCSLEVARRLRFIQCTESCDGVHCASMVAYSSARLNPAERLDLVAQPIRTCAGNRCDWMLRTVLNMLSSTPT